MFTRECTCGNFLKDRPWTPEQCYLCWTYYNNKEYREHLQSIEEIIDVDNSYEDRLVLPEDFTPQKDDPRVAVVIGAYKYVEIVEILTIMLQKTCGNIIICISDDGSEKINLLEDISNKYDNVLLWPNVERIGHAGGDLACLWKAALLGKIYKLDAVCKLSQRFIPLKSRWLQDGAKELLAGDYAFATHCCKGREEFEHRTECVLLNCKYWSQNPIINALYPKKYNRVAEHFFAEFVQENFSSNMMTWDFLNNNRFTYNENYLWHRSNHLKDYFYLAKKLKKKLPLDFSINGWEQERIKGNYVAG